MIYKSFSADETKKIGKELGQDAKKGQIYCLIGDLGVGKTVFTKGFAEGLGIDEHITSPTFTIVNEYHTDKFNFNHFDVYRIDDPDEMYEIGYEEYFYNDGVCLIEWANLIKEIIPEEAIWINIEKDLDKGLDYRQITIAGGINR
ncbi:tRNA (adenosine(37)-N6)-threonylcarbamoyltransferase complex ATPase subunit type 1 TsaE [Vallitalea sp.]|uniref:tRNA (adenosine(37)-N6)-threonylcarbamoyltransferase complex ATPase subunit type 1 TsaE n=1 Tax=Vallitalea sp. TaxID=1882829 RepID=UPI0025E47CC7|nr:tRNA (adenosine(37)-N6)-threonylcarbamoyltransferase complex ATPase subunit type 1 TsaE [Vallitalea sp.]MCT4688643.1 tRNA (adenosine(37)-N6)-threonylcarbamoyltransferase complex ATPase subunit type 1 TsaE [Vallitalea sp.]